MEYKEIMDRENTLPSENDQVMYYEGADDVAWQLQKQRDKESMRNVRDLIEIKKNETRIAKMEAETALDATSRCIEMEAANQEWLRKELRRTDLTPEQRGELYDRLERSLEQARGCEQKCREDMRTSPYREKTPWKTIVGIAVVMLGSCCFGGLVLKRVA